MAVAFVRIDGEVYPSGWDGTSAVALGDLSIVWGVSSRYDDPPPAALSLSIIDPAGTALTRQYQGRTIEVATTAGFLDGTVKFRGRIQNADAELVTVRSPLTGKPVDVWQLELTAKDPLADLATAKVKGPNTDGSWPQQSVAARMAAILTIARTPLLQTVPTPGAAVVKGYGPDASTNLLDLARRAWWAGAGYVRRLQYNPRFADNPGLDEAFTRPNQGVRLVYSGNRLELAVHTGNDAIVPAGKVALPAGKKFTSTVEQAIDVVQVVTQNAAGDKIVAERQTDRYTPDYGVRVYKVESDLVDSAPDEWRAGLLVAQANQINGQYKHPRIRVRWSPTVNDPTFPQVSRFIRTWVEDEGWYFLGSQFQHLPGPGMHQVIGGTLTCDGKTWQHDMTIAPAANTEQALPNVTIAQLVTNPTARFDQFDPRITLADLGNVTEGAA